MSASDGQKKRPPETWKALSNSGFPRKNLEFVDFFLGKQPQISVFLVPAGGKAWQSVIPRLERVERAEGIAFVLQILYHPSEYVDRLVVRFVREDDERRVLE